MKRFAMLASVLILFAAAAFAQFDEEIAWALDLSEDQKTQIDEIILRLERQGEFLELDLRQAEINLRRELLDDEPDLEVLRGLNAEVYAKTAEMEFLYIELIVRLKGILTPGQFRLWQEIEANLEMEQHEEHREFDEHEEEWADDHHEERDEYDYRENRR